ncbi:hypothetical protein niasHT_031350 [Heterodera trifolii]|uniref:Uncharacterized protein n=1 Tax=Heterodera trifolii TaxID=157864 RepID=A0ABD2IRJ9_9BILA
MSDRRKEAEKKMEKAIFISADCWLCVFDFLTPSQLGLGIALISHRFDFYVYEHFKTRKRTLKPIQIKRKIGENGTNQMEIVNSTHSKSLPIPQKPLPKKVVGFKTISFEYIDNNVIAFLHCFRPLLTICPIYLNINAHNDRVMDFILHNIWPMLGKNLYGVGLPAKFFRRLRQFVPSLFTNLPLLRVAKFYLVNVFPKFPADDSAAASDGQMVAKWIFTPLQNDVPKVLKCWLDIRDASWIEASKAAFASASSPVNFIVSVCFYPPFAASVVPFVLTNELTREQLTLKMENNIRYFLLIRCPIARDANKWTKWEEEASVWQNYRQWNLIDISICGEKDIGDGLLDATPGSSDQQK